MSLRPITEYEMKEAGVVSLPTRPTSPREFGGRGYTPAELKSAFDRLPRLVASRYNELVAALTDGACFADIPYESEMGSTTLKGFLDACTARFQETEEALAALSQEKQDVLAFDTLPTVGSTYPVTSDGIAVAIEEERQSRLAAEKLLRTVLCQTVVTDTEVRDNYSVRETAGGLTIVDGVPTTVHMVRGNTVSSQNLFPLTPRAAFVSSISTDNNTWTFGGFTPGNNYTNFIDEINITDFLEDGETFTLSQSKYYTGADDAGAVYLNVQVRSGGNIVVQHTCVTGAKAVTMDKSLGTWFLRVICGNNRVEMNQTVSFMVNRGAAALPYSDYYAGLKNTYFKGVLSEGTDGAEDASFALDEPIELGRWDYIDVDRQKIVRRTEAFTTGQELTDEEISLLSSNAGDGLYVLSADRKSVAFKLDTTIEEDFQIPASYLAWRGGTETVVQGETDNAVFGAKCTVTQSYLVINGEEQTA